MECHILCNASHHKCLRKVWAVEEIIFEVRHRVSRVFQLYHVRTVVVVFYKCGLYAEQTEEVSCYRVALLAVVH